MPKDMTSAYGVEDTSRADAQTYPSPATIPERRRLPETTARRAAVTGGWRLLGDISRGAQMGSSVYRVVGSAGESARVQPGHRSV
jgi:hypothetical protein